MNKVFAAAVVSALVMFGSVGGVTANTPPQTSIEERVGSRGPDSFRMFCAVSPWECVPGGAPKISLSSEVLQVITRVNSRVNRSIRPRLDDVALQMWRVNPGAGDCKSFVVSKRHELIEAGLPASALRIAYVNTRDGQGHAVLVIKTNQGDLTLDNLTNDIKALGATGYRVIAMSQADPKRWS